VREGTGLILTPDGGCVSLHKSVTETAMPHVWIYPPPEPGKDDPADIPPGNPPWLVVVDNEDGTYDCSPFKDEQAARNAVEQGMLRGEVAGAKTI